MVSDWYGSVIEFVLVIYFHGVGIGALSDPCRSRDMNYGCVYSCFWSKHMNRYSSPRSRPGTNLEPYAWSNMSERASRTHSTACRSSHVLFHKDSWSDSL